MHHFTARTRYSRCRSNTVTIVLITRFASRSAASRKVDRHEMQQPRCCVRSVDPSCIPKFAQPMSNHPSSSRPLTPFPPNKNHFLSDVKTMNHDAYAVLRCNPSFPFREGI
jgi:hypothetical protein